MDEVLPVLKQGETCNGFLTDVSFSSDRELTIWAQIGDKVEGLLNDITVQLHEECPNRQHVSEIQIGLLCACKYLEDEQWYRASIVRQTSPGKWIARFIDYGNCQEFSDVEFFSLSSKLKQIPPLATALLLDGSLQPVESAFLWTSTAAKTLMDLLLYSEIEITLSNVYQDRAEVFCPMISDVLLTKGLAVHEKHRYPFSDFPIGRKFDVYVSSATIRGTLLVQELGSSALLDQLMDLMTEHFGCLENRIALVAEDIAPGCLVAAMYGCDQSFYRAQVVNIVNNHTCTIFYIDYGNQEEQAITSLFQLPKKFCQLPYQSIECELHDVTVSPQKYSKELQSFLIKQTSGVVVNCDIVDHLFASSVKFSVAAKCEDDKLSSFLIAKNYARTRRDAETLEYPYVEIDKGSQHQVFISHVEPNGTFYVSLMSDVAKLDKLMTEIENYCADAKPPSQVSVGMSCFAFYDQDQSWCRAQVKNIDDDSCKVLYVDYGNSETCSISSLRRTSKKFMSLHCQAIECSILRPLTDEENTLLENLIGEDIEVKFLRNADKVNSYNVKVVHEGKVLFPPLVKKDQAITDFEQQKIQLSTTEKIKILSATSPDDMWARLVCNEDKLQKLCADLNEIYNNRSGSLKFEERLAVDNLCAVHDADYNQWCRGKVVSLKSSNSFSVFLVDVGIVKSYTMNKICRIESSELLKLPCQAFNFMVEGSKMKDIYKAHPNKFSSFFLDNSFSAEFVSFDKSANLYMLQLYNSNNIPVKEALSLAMEKSATNEDSDEQSVGISNDHVTKLQAALPVPLNETYVEVAICFVEDPDCMWLQLQSNSTVLFKLINDMQAFYSQIPSNVLTFHQPQYDALCAVKVKNEGAENWYRGRILCLYADVVEAQLIDFGSEVKVKQKDVKMLSTRFSQPDAQAIKCKLYNISPAAKRWSNSAVRELNKLANDSNDSVSVLAKFLERHRSSYIVDLKVNESGNTFHVNAHLVKNEHAVWLNKSCLPTDSALPFESNKPLQRTAISPSSMNKKPKVFYQSPGVAFVGAELDVFASEVTSPNDFFLQINDACHRQKYAALMRDLNTACAKNTCQSLYEDNFYVGLPCAVFYSRVGQWCRGAVLDYSDLESLQICLVDYGCNICCPLNEVKTIDMQLVMKAPPEAMRCTVQGIVAPKNSQWPPEAIDLCSDFFESDQRNLSCTVHACAGNDFCSYFICSVRTPLRNLADELVTAGYGVTTSVMGKVDPPLKLKSFIYSNLGQIKGKEDVFYVTHVEAQNLFFCQLSKQFPEIDTMMDELQLHCDNNTSAVTVDKLIRDCMCFAKYDGKWYRAHVVAPAGTDLVKVMFVDYGNSEIVQLCDVQRFNNDLFYDLPIQALPCSFKDIEVATAEQQQETLMLMNTMLLEQEFEGVVIGSTNGKFHLDLFQEGKRINDIVIKKTVAQTSEPVEASDKNDHSRDSQSKKLANLAEPVFLGNGVTESVTLASCVDPHNFYLWLDKLDEERATCISTIDGQYTAMRNSDYKLQSISPGDLICARRSKDMKWCRAKVVSVSDSEVEVFYVDTGECDTVLRAYDVKQLIVNMGKWPKMAIPCTLEGVEAADSDGWSSKAVLEFQYFIKNCQLCAQFLYKDGKSEKWVVKLNKGDMDFSSHLVDMGVAKHADPLSNGEVRIDSSCTWKGEKEVFVSCVVSESEVYLQSVEAFDKLKELKTQMLRDNSHQPLSSKPEPHTFCLAKYDVDDHIYRAEVLDSQPNKGDSNACLVRFVDFGITTFVKVSDMFVLNPKYASALQLAVQCKVSSLPDTLVSSETFEKLKSMSLSDDISIFASFVENEFVDDNTVNLRILQGENQLISLDNYLTEHDVITKRTVETTELQYSTIQNILNQASRSIYVSHVENPGHIFCQLSEFCNDLDTLMDSIEDYYEKAHPEDEIKSVSSLPIGSPCVAKYPADNAWYRAVVEDVIDAEQLKVRFVDYGNSESLSLSMVRRSKVGFCTLPIQAIHCYLALVDHNSSSWTEDEITEFDNRVASLQLKATFSRLISEEDSIFEVMLRLPDETLLNKDNIKNNISTAAAKFPDDITEMDRINSSTPTTSLDVEDQKDTSECIIVSDLELHEGEIKDCYISYAERTSNFYLQIAGTEDTLASLYSLVTNDVQSNKSASSNEESHPVGRFCVAKSPDDGQWYRGRISKLGVQPTIFFIDYGNCSVVDWNLVKPISKTSSSIPTQAICCSLNGLSHLSPAMIDEAVDVFFDLVESAMISVTFMKKIGSIWEVSIKTNGVDVAEKIKDVISRKYPELALNKDEEISSRVAKDMPFASGKIYDPQSPLRVCPGMILLCKVVFVVNSQSFYVKTLNEIGTCSSTALASTACMVKQHEDDPWKAGVSIQANNNELIVMDNDEACFSNQLVEVKITESAQEKQFEIFQCQLSNSGNVLEANEATDKLLSGKLIKKDVFVTFKIYEEKLAKWEVELSLSAGNIFQLLQNKSDTGPESTQASTNDDQDHHGGIEECIRYNTLVFKQLKEMLINNEPQEKAITLIENAMQKLDMYGSTLSKCKFTDDHKRPFSVFLSNPSPCKKPRLEKRTVGYRGASLMFEPIPEQDEEKIIDISVSDFLKSSLAYVESPGCFYVKPNALIDHCLPAMTVDKLCKLDKVESNLLCAFCADEKAPDSINRGIILSESNGDIVVLDIDAGFKSVLTPDKVFAYPKEWSSFKPLVVKCSLYRVIPVDSEWSSDACLFFCNMVEGANGHDPMLVEFVQKNDTDELVQDWKVNVVFNNKSLCSQLVERNYAVSNDENLYEFVQTPSSNTEEHSATLFQSSLADAIEEKGDAQATDESQTYEDAKSSDKDIRIMSNDNVDGNESESEDDDFQSADENLSEKDKYDEVLEESTPGFAEECSPVASEGTRIADLCEPDLHAQTAKDASQTEEPAQRFEENGENHAEDVGLTPPLYVQKVIGYKLKLVHSASSYLSDSVFDEDKDFSQDTTEEEPFSIPQSSAHTGTNADDRMPGFITPRKSGGRKVQDSSDPEAQEAAQDEEIANVLTSDDSLSLAELQRQESDQLNKSHVFDVSPSPEETENNDKDAIIAAKCSLVKDAFTTVHDTTTDVDQLQCPFDNGDTSNSPTRKEQRLPTFVACGSADLYPEQPLSPPKSTAESAYENQDLDTNYLAQSEIVPDVVPVVESQSFHDLEKLEDESFDINSPDQQRERCSFDIIQLDESDLKQASASTHVQSLGNDLIESQQDPTLDNKSKFEKNDAIDQELTNEIEDKVKEDFNSELDTSGQLLVDQGFKSFKSSSDIEDADDVKINYVTVEDSLRGVASDLPKDVVKEDSVSQQSKAESFESATFQVDADVQEPCIEPLEATVDLDSDLMQEEQKERDVADGSDSEVGDDGNTQAEECLDDKIDAIPLQSDTSSFADSREHENTADLPSSLVALPFPAAQDEAETEVALDLEQSSLEESVADTSSEAIGVVDNLKPNCEESKQSPESLEQNFEELEPNREESESICEESELSFKESESSREESELVRKESELSREESEPIHEESELSRKESESNGEESELIRKESELISEESEPHCEELEAVDEIDKNGLVATEGTQLEARKDVDAGGEADKDDDFYDAQPWSKAP